MKVAKIRHVFVELHRIVFTKVSLCLQINGKQNTTVQFSVKLFSNKIHEATFKLVLTWRQFMLIAHTELLLQIIEGYWVIFKRWKTFLLIQNCLKRRGYRNYTYFCCHNIAILIKIWTLTLNFTTIGIIYNKITHLVLSSRQIEHILINVNTSLRSRKMLENDIKCDNSVYRGRSVLKTYEILSMF